MSEQESQSRLIVVALISLFQAYLRELLEEQADRLGTNWHELTELEKRYVGVQSLRRLADFFEKDSDDELAEPKRVDALRNAVLDCAAWQNNPALLTHSSHRQKLDGFLQNNGSRVLDRIISRYSVCDLSFFNWLNKLHPRYRGLADSLDIVIATRNDVAHGSFERRVTLRNVREFRVWVYRTISMIELYIRTRSDGSVRPEPSHGEISQRAFFLWVERGGGHHDSMEDWFKAEKELRNGG